MNIVTDQRERVAEFVASIDKSCSGSFEDVPGIGVEIGGELVGGVVFPNWDTKAGTIEACAGALSPRWLTLSLIRLMMDYVFNQLGCQMLIWRTGERNRQVRRLAMRCGLKEYVIPRGRGADEAMIVFTLTDDQWRSHRFNGEG